MNANKYYCDGICEKCVFAKHYTENNIMQHTCDPNKIDVTIVEPPYLHE